MTKDGRQGVDALRSMIDQALQLADAHGNALVAAKLADALDTIDQQQESAA